MAGRARVRTIVVATVVALTAFGAPAGARDSLPTLKGTTVLRGDRSGFVRVRVTEPAVIDLSMVSDGSGKVGPAALKTEGGKGHVGFLLTKAGSVNGPFVLAVRTPTAMIDGSTTRWGVGHGQPAVDDRTTLTATGPGGAHRCTECRVPAGIYDLHLITRSKPTKVTLTLASGTGGRQVLTPGTVTNTFDWVRGMSSRKAPEYSGGGGMWMGAGWPGRRESGVLLNTYSVATKAEDVAAAGIAQGCRSTGETETCDDPRIFGGASTRVAASEVMAGSKVRGVGASVVFDVMGSATYAAKVGILWVSLTPLPTLSFGPAPERVAPPTLRFDTTLR
jgi:hypothetical protein